MGKFAKRHGGKIVGSDSSDRPGWKGPGYVKKAEPKPKKQKESKEPEEPADVTPKQILPVELQQLLLNIFRDTFPDLLASETLKPTLQEVKQALYERDFLRAFGKEEYLEAYSIRWSPSRALCYASILVDIRKHLDGILQDAQEDNSVTPPESALRIVSFGGGAAETVACGGFLRYLHDASASPDETHDTVEATDNITATLDDLTINPRTARKTELLLLDTAKWGEVVTRLHSSLYALPTMSKYASASAKQANKSLIREGDLSTTFQCEDVLNMSLSQLGTIVGKCPMLVTLLFTLNELYTASIAKTTAFLLHLTTVVKPGSLLLVVDSPGSYSETIVGKEAKKYPMHFLLDHTLIETTKGKGTDGKPTWEKIMSEDSHWFRLPKEHKYLIDLEDMRYQVHLYRRL